MEEFWQTILAGVLTGSVLVAIIEGIREWLTWWRDRKAKKEDHQVEREEKEIEARIEKLEAQMTEMNESIESLIFAQRSTLYDRIRHLGQKYLEAGCIDLEDRRLLHLLHAAYHGDETHKGLGGNGDLNLLMEDVDKLPLRKG